MKKIILAIMCVVLTLVMLTACGRENVGDYTEKPSQNTTSMTTTTSTTTKKTTENNTTGVLTPSTGATTQSTTKAS